MHSEEKVHKGFIRNNLGIECDLDCFGVPRSSRTDLVIGRFRGASACIADDNLVKFVWEMFAIELFGACIFERICQRKSVPQKQPCTESNVSTTGSYGERGAYIG